LAWLVGAGLVCKTRQQGEHGHLQGVGAIANRALDLRTKLSGKRCAALGPQWSEHATQEVLACRFGQPALAIIMNSIEGVQS